MCHILVFTNPTLKSAVEIPDRNISGDFNSKMSCTLFPDHNLKLRKKVRIKEIFCVLLMNCLYVNCEIDNTILNDVVFSTLYYNFLSDCCSLRRK